MVTSIREIAALAKVSVTTVSRVLRNNGYVSESVRKRVLEVVESQNYHINLNARGLRSNSTNIIGIIGQNPYVTPYYGAVAKGILQACNERDYEVITFLVGSPEEELRAVKLAIERRLDGILFSTVRNLQSLELLHQYNIPIVLIERFFDVNYVGKAGVENSAGAFMATEHLIGLGHERIAILSGDLDPGNPTKHVDADRFSGYCQALAKHGLPLDEAIVALQDYGVSNGFKAVDGFIKRGERFTAVFATSDTLALGAYNALAFNGYKVPEDCSIISFENVLPDYFMLPLTVVDQHVIELGHAGADLLIEHIASKKPFSGKEELLAMDLIQGKTVERPGRGVNARKPRR